jgi:hypothetical protein
MSYESSEEMINDATFQGRVRSCTIEQAGADPAAGGAEQAMSDSVLRGDTMAALTFTRIIATFPGLPEKQEDIEDAEILSHVQGNWAKVAGLYYNTDGTPVTVGMVGPL